MIIKIIKNILKAFLALFLSLAILLLTLFVSSCIAGFLQIDKNIEFQNNHLEYLKNEYYTDSYVTCDEQSLADFNIEDASDDKDKEIINVLKRGCGFANGDQEIYRIMNNSENKNKAISKLKETFNSYGYSYTFLNGRKK